MGHVHLPVAMQRSSGLTATASMGFRTTGSLQAQRAGEARDTSQTATVPLPPTVAIMLLCWWNHAAPLTPSLPLSTAPGLGAACESSLSGGRG